MDAHALLPENLDDAPQDGRLAGAGSARDHEGLVGERHADRLPLLGGEMQPGDPLDPQEGLLHVDPHGEPRRAEEIGEPARHLFLRHVQGLEVNAPAALRRFLRHHHAFPGEASDRVRQQRPGGLQGRLGRAEKIGLRGVHVALVG
jgi:hypothetical protein